MESLNKERNNKKKKLNLSGKLTKKKQFHPFVDWQPFSLKLPELLCTFTNSTVFLYKLYISIKFSCILVAFWQHNILNVDVINYPFNLNKTIVRENLTAYVYLSQSIFCWEWLKHFYRCLLFFWCNDRFKISPTE